MRGASAEQCWRSCCCHTLAERFAWAREHNVRPPEYAIAAAKVATAGSGVVGNQDITANCDGRAASCCRQVANSSAPRPCCQKRASAAKCAGGQVCRKLAKRNQRTMAKSSCRAFLACHGQSMNWLAAVPTLIVARRRESYDTAGRRLAWASASETAERPVISGSYPFRRNTQCSRAFFATVFCNRSCAYCAGVGLHLI